MTQQSVVSRERLVLKGHAFQSFAKSMDKNIGKNISENLSGTNSEKLLDHAKQSATDPTKTSSKKLIQETAEATGDLTGNKIADVVPESQDCKITKVLKNSPQNSLGIVKNENDKEITKYITDDLILI